MIKGFENLKTSAMKTENNMPSQVQCIL